MRAYRNGGLRIAFLVTLLLVVAGTFGLIRSLNEQPIEETVDVAPQEMYYQGFYDACMVFMIRIQEVDREEALVNCDKVTKAVSDNDMHQTVIEEPNAVERWLRIWRMEDGMESA